MQTFKFKYSKTLWIILIALVIVSAVGLGFNIYNATKFFEDSSIVGGVLFILASLLSAFLLVLAVSIIFHGCYKIKDGILYSFFGFIFERTPVNDIIAITKFAKQNKIVTYFVNEKFSVVIIDEKYYDDFVSALLKVNPSIIFRIEDNLDFTVEKDQNNSKK